MLHKHVRHFSPFVTRGLTHPLAASGSNGKKSIEDDEVLDVDLQFRIEKVLENLAGKLSFCIDAVLETEGPYIFVSSLVEDQKFYSFD